MLDFYRTPEGEADIRENIRLVAKAFVDYIESLEEMSFEQIRQMLINYPVPDYPHRFCQVTVRSQKLTKKQMKCLNRTVRNFQMVPLTENTFSISFRCRLF